MAYIGYEPAKVPLTSADITDGIIVNADISSTAGITLNKVSGNPSFRNLIINGDMQISQRSTSLASITTGGYKTLDRYYLGLSSLGTWTQSQSTDVPLGYGFSSSLKMDNTTADASPAAGDSCFITQIIEGQNLQSLKKGTANAVSLTASFWVKSTKTGTFIVELYDYINNRSISKSYTVVASNTWEFKTVTFAGDTTGTITNSNVAGMEINFWLGAGSNYTSGTLQTSWGSYTAANRAVGQVNCADSTSNDFLITGIQLEAGTSATDFEFLPYDVSLQRCLRYYYKISAALSSSADMGTLCYANGTTTGFFHHFFKVSMRGTPALSFSGTFQLTDAIANNYAITNFSLGNFSTEMTRINVTVSSGLTSKNLYFPQSNATSSSYIDFSSEL